MPSRRSHSPDSGGYVGLHTPAIASHQQSDPEKFLFRPGRKGHRRKRVMSKKKFGSWPSDRSVRRGEACGRTATRRFEHGFPVPAFRVVIPDFSHATSIHVRQSPGTLQENPGTLKENFPEKRVQPTRTLPTTSGKCRASSAFGSCNALRPEELGT